MHLLRLDEHRTDDAEVAVDLEQTAADLVVLSFSDNDLGAMAEAADARDRQVGAGGRAEGPSLRLANLNRLRHPYSVDLYLETVAAHARFVLVRLLGGLDYWRYGAEELGALARSKGIRLAILPGDGRDDARLEALSTLPKPDLQRLWRWFSFGGTGNMGSLLGWIEQELGSEAIWTEPRPVPPAGRYVPACRAAAEGTERGRALIVFYRALVLAGDCQPIVALADALAARGLTVTALYATSLKEEEAAARLASEIASGEPDVVINTTAFSGRGESGGIVRPSVLDRADAPVIQAILAGASEQAWRSNPRGLGAADLAMNVVLPEMDGRLIAAAVSGKAELARDPRTQYGRLVHKPIASRVAAVADLAAAWVRLRRTAPAERRVALVCSDYPGKAGREGYAIGLDTPASIVAIAADLRAAGYSIGVLPPLDALMPALKTGAAGGDENSSLPLDHYRTLFDALPRDLRRAVLERWGEPADDAACRNGAFRFPHVAAGALTVALQPDRGSRDDRKTEFHDPALPPRHGYIAFYFWLRHVRAIDALVHCGTHGTLEWLPGKPVALDESCAPEALLGPTPLIYPFIVNNPGEAAQAKRRNAAVAIGHLTPPLVEAGHHGAALEVEALLDEYAAAINLDPKRARLIARAALDRARDSGLAAEAGLSLAMSNDDSSQLASLDAWLCDLKELRLRDGLHIFGRGDDASCARGEREGLLAALSGRFVPGGPSGAPSRGREDVLPTGRNLYGTDPRAVPSRTAFEIGRRAADAVAERHAQDQGEWLRSLVIDLWASATMRTAGEDIAQAMAHLGVQPRWADTTSRVTGFTILPYATLARPRVDVTLRISGLFRDIFPAQIALFDQAVRAVALLDEDVEINPLAAARRAGESNPLRVFGGAPSTYGMGMGRALGADPDLSRADLGRSYLAAATHAFAGAEADAVAAPDAFAARVATANAFVHTGDMADLDTLDAEASVEAEGGFAAAAAMLGSAASLYHLDTSRAERPVARTQAEEISRIVRGRAGNPRWIAGQMRHGHRGAAEIAETVDNLFAMAVMSDAVQSRHFDLVFAATCGADDVRGFLLANNRDAARAIADRFRAAARRGLWTSRRNSDAATLDDMLRAAA